ncbi:MAG TPA: rhomboid family intramembrane serine protease, partial [Tepidisphaeraceae bacterium]|nr:rhomboid family intramembrane serine protease [Tepidisphaeraceae bacterium]
YDRDYYREKLPRGGFGHFSALSITTWLIVINVAVFFVDAALHRADPPPPRHFMFDDDSVDQDESPNPEQMMLDTMGPLQRWGYFSTEKAVHHGQIWRFLTFQFLHASPMHLVFNMIGIYFFGPIVEAQFGSRRYLAFYLLCGLAGAVCYLLLSVTQVLHTDPTTPLVGASAGIFGLLVAAAMIAPNVQVFYYLFPVTIGMLALFGMLMALYSIISLGYNAGGEAGHLGGGILGFVIMKNQHWLNVLTPQRRRVARPSIAKKRGAIQKDWSKDLNR